MTPINGRYKYVRLEGVQRRTTKMIQNLRNLFKEGLKRLDMFSLRHRRLKGDLIEMFKMIHGIDKANLFLIDGDGRTRK